MSTGVSIENPHRELVTKVFKPGNLVWGGDFYNARSWRRFQETGILSPQARRSRGHCFIWKEISLALLSKDPAPYNRYNDAHHHGPQETKHEDPDVALQIGVVISRERLLDRFPQHAMAVGKNFTGSGIRPDLYEFDDAKRTVFGIPVMEYDDDYLDPYPDEIRLYPAQEEKRLQAITPDLWEGVIIAGYSDETWDRWKRLGFVSLDLPEFTPYLSPLDEPFSEEVLFHTV